MKQGVGKARKDYLDSLEDIQYYIDEASDLITRKINDE